MLFYIYRSDVLLTLSSFYVLTALLGAAAAGLGSSLGAVPGGQPSAPNLNPPSQIDPSSIERAYAALGLTYQGNQIQVQTAQPNMSNQGLQGQAGMRPLNPMGELGFMSTCFTVQKDVPSLVSDSTEGQAFFQSPNILKSKRIA